MYYELLFFFIHITRRTAFEQGFNETQMGKLQAYVGPALAHVAVDTFFQHLPIDRKKIDEMLIEEDKVLSGLIRSKKESS